MKTERATNWFPYLYAIMVLIVIQFLAMLWLVGSIEIQMDYLRGAVNRLKVPVRNEVVTVTFGMEDEGDPGIGGGYGDGRRDPRLLTVFQGNLYEMRRVK